MAKFFVCCHTSLLELSVSLHDSIGMRHLKACVWFLLYFILYAFSLSDFTLHSLIVISVSITALLKPVSLENLQAEGGFGDP